MRLQLYLVPVLLLAASTTAYPQDPQAGSGGIGSTQYDSIEATKGQLDAALSRRPDTTEDIKNTREHGSLDQHGSYFSRLADKFRAMRFLPDRRWRATQKSEPPIKRSVIIDDVPEVISTWDRLFGSSKPVAASVNVGQPVRERRADSEQRQADTRKRPALQLSPVARGRTSIANQHRPITTGPMDYAASPVSEKTPALQTSTPGSSSTETKSRAPRPALQLTPAAARKSLARDPADSVNKAKSTHPSKSTTSKTRKATGGKGKSSRITTKTKSKSKSKKKPKHKTKKTKSKKKEAESRVNQDEDSSFDHRAFQYYQATAGSVSVQEEHWWLHSRHLIEEGNNDRHQIGEWRGELCD
ncbi:hypothetical protein KVT40_000577 [Elsinoe batatas]|uniref:Uncharacterized protein n=1 Tax=Elsinoe batatas TaxID=2601811 RepID=A0A8K0L9K2_9PEZI|nr:hypothetical protein KVT40_000577 [Elsinoe batatas]